MKPARILFVDDDDTLRRVLTRELSDLGFEVRALPSAQGVVEAVREDCPDAVLLDMRLPGTSGLEVLKQIRAADESCQVVVFTGHGAVPEAVEAMRLGAHDFLTKPARLEVIEQALRRAAEKHALIEDVARLKRALEPKAGTTGLLGQGPAIQRLRREIERVAASASSVLVQGENGTGKELVARNIHALSPRAEAPFVVVNCGAIPATLFESEVFGHEKGAFTGADRRRIGLCEAAHGGTLFLDEIGELPKAVQPVLLRAIQFGEVRPVGSERTRRVDVRVVAATNRRLSDMIARGEFREDLYYRVATLVIEVPPLRERREDVGELARAFIDRCAARSGRRLELDGEALRRLERYDWPGNVRELENAAERLSVMCDGEVVTADLVARYVERRDLSSAELPTLEIEDLERRAVVAALERHRGDKKAAAKALGIALKTLYNKLDRFGLRPAPASGADDEPADR
ncbi:MAG: sigma-54-dependent Fis family transcriptional regulator [Planctomycetes bacterium]|nr:sigma-54-dependent Fis family transcriptional regulator [Planctomycetota bacterium]